VYGFKYLSGRISIYLITSYHHTTPSGHMPVFLITLLPLLYPDVCIPNHLQLPYHPTYNRQSLVRKLGKLLWLHKTLKYKFIPTYNHRGEAPHIPDFSFIPMESSTINHGKETDWNPELFSYH
jgi:hypothetical protein